MESYTQGVRDPLQHVFELLSHPRNDQYRRAIHDAKQTCCHCHHTKSRETPDERVRITKLFAKKERWRLPFDFALCPDFLRLYELVDYIGDGSFGVVYAAKPLQGDLNRRYAVKIEARYKAEANGSVIGRSEPIGERYIEAIVHAMMEPSGAVASLVGVYIHGALICMVMELFGGVEVDLGHRPPLRERIEPDTQRHHLPTLRTCTGDKFAYPSHRPRVKLAQIEVCRIFWCLLGGFAWMTAAGISHNDFATRNYLVDYDFRAKIIDFGLAALHPYDDDFNVNRRQTNKSPWKYSQRGYRCGWQNSDAHPPEFLHTGYTPEDTIGSRIWDVRRFGLWQYGVCIYEVLHGAMPWRHIDLEAYSDQEFVLASSKQRPVRAVDESREVHRENVKMWKRVTRQIELRNLKVVNEPLPVREDLDQDCVDVLQALFVKDPLLRCDVVDLVTFPWFQGWHENDGYRFYNHMTTYSRPSPEINDSPGTIEACARRRAALANMTDISDSEEEKGGKGPDL